MNEKLKKFYISGMAWIPSYRDFDQYDTTVQATSKENALEVFKTGSHDSVIAVGGGSVIDLAKLVALMALQTRPIWDYEDVDDNWK